jgi:flagellar assembly protein FliH
MAAYAPFTFDTEFGDAGAVLPKAAQGRRFFNAEDLEAARAESFAQGERSASARAAAETAAAISALAAAAQGALTALAAAAHDHKAGAATLALAAAGQIADAALERFPEAAAAAALETLAREVEAAPRLLLRVRPEQVDALTPAVEQAALSAGYPGALVIKADPGLAPAAFVYEWGDGRAAFDPGAAARRVAEVLAAALAAEGLHGEPVLQEHM